MSDYRGSTIQSRMVTIPENRDRLEKMLNYQDVNLEVSLYSLKQ